jgi:hypothetical protein
MPSANFGYIDLYARLFGRLQLLKKNLEKI